MIKNNQNNIRKRNKPYYKMYIPKMLGMNKLKLRLGLQNPQNQDRI